MKPHHILPLVALLSALFTTAQAQAQTDPYAEIGYHIDNPRNFNVRDSLASILYGPGDSGNQARFQAAYDLLQYNDVPGHEVESLGLEIVRPFILKADGEDEQWRMSSLSLLYLEIGFIHRERGGDDSEEKLRTYLEKALEAALLSGSGPHCAICYYAVGNLELKRGNIGLSHQYLYEAIKHYGNLGAYTIVTEVFFCIGSGFSDIRDTEGLGRVLAQMEENLGKDNSLRSRHFYNILKHTYFTILQEQERKAHGKASQASVDSAMVYVRANIDLVDNHIEELAPNYFHGYAYYYLAKELDANDPERNREIFEALDRAVAITERDIRAANNYVRGETASFREFHIMVNSLRMKALYRTGRLGEAREVLDRTLVMLAEFEHFENLNYIRSTVYEFAATLRQKTGELEEALRFQQQYAKSEARAYEKEKVRAMNEMSAKYESEIKQGRIDILTQKNRAARRQMMLLAGLILVTLTASGFVVVWNRQRRRNIEQKLYETALLAELRQEELDKMRMPEQTPVADTIARISRQVADSPSIGRDVKRKYLDNLSHLDGALMENAYRNSEARLTPLDIKYIICFNAGMSVPDIGDLFSVEPASVNTVRYRIRKKFAQNDPFRTII